MLRIVILFIVAILLLAALAAGVVGLGQSHVSLTLPGYAIETSAAVALFAVALIVAILLALAASLAALLSAPRRFRLHRAGERLRRGYQAFARGMVAVAAGDARAAERYAKEAKKLQADSALTLLLGAQAAQLTGDDKGAEDRFTLMLASKETEFLGLRGLFVQATRRGDRAVALAHLKRAAALRPGTAWVVNALFDLHAAEARWSEAEATLEEARKARLVDDALARRRRAVLLAAEAQALLAKDRPRALGLAEEAVRLSPGLVPAAALAARLLGEDDRAWRAQGIIENAWAQSPHPDLAQVYAGLKPEEPPRARATRLMGLAERNPDHVESRLLTAQQLLVLRDFAQARTALGDLPERLPSARVAAAMGEIAQGMGAAGEMRYWLDRAVRAPREPQWCCDNCQTQAQSWAPVCPHCGAFDTLAWRTRTTMLALEAPGPGAPPAAEVQGGAVVPFAPSPRAAPAQAPAAAGAAPATRPRPPEAGPTRAPGARGPREAAVQWFKGLAQRWGDGAPRARASEAAGARPAERMAAKPAATAAAEPVIFISPRPPDDPGPGTENPEEQGSATKW